MMCAEWRASSRASPALSRNIPLWARLGETDEVPPRFSHVQSFFVYFAKQSNFKSVGCNGGVPRWRCRWNARLRMSHEWPDNLLPGKNKETFIRSILRRISRNTHAAPVA